MEQEEREKAMWLLGYNNAIEDVIARLQADKQNLFVHNADKSLCEDVIDLNIMSIRELKK